MKKAVIVLVMALLLGWQPDGFTQQKPDYLSMEAQVQAAYAKRDWQSVLKLTQLAVLNRIDYFALRQRAGIASFSRGDFTQSIEHLTAARRFNHHDATTLTYLYYSLLQDGRAAEAVAQAHEYPTAVSDQLGIRPSQFITSLTIESGIKLSSIPDQVGNATYWTVGFGHRLNPFMHLYQTVGYLRQLYGNDLLLNQVQYTARADLRFSPDWLLSPAFQWFSVKGAGTTITDLRQNGTVFHLNLTRSGAGWKLFPILTYSTINNAMQAATPFESSANTPASGSFSERQWQLGVGGEYALHRLRLVGSYELQAKTGSNGPWNSIWNLNAGFTASPAFRVRAGYGYFHTNNFLESTTGIFNNVPDPTLDKTTLLFNWGLGKRSSLYLLGQYERKEAPMLNQNYRYLTVSGGITFHF
ncbi:hypothetical protein [Spirosoma aerolatum]|uniref:hypothetical protein n=1 Tax=Spirosoma aerolatum TaxID=1211326 RepID=UPI0009ABC8DC|nr:hypothetical protein [Spirosoma aerolatum]